jgi:hypothetical protein
VRKKQRKATTSDVMEVSLPAAEDQFARYQSDDSSPSISDVEMLMSTPELEFDSLSPEPEALVLQEQDIGPETETMENASAPANVAAPFSPNEESLDVAMDDPDEAPPTLNGRERLGNQARETDDNDSATSDLNPQTNP